jgi:hypothetical protein
MQAESLSLEIARILHSDEETVASNLFIQLLRRAPLLRHWLWHEFARSEPTRTRFTEFLCGRIESPVPVGPKLFSWLAGEQAAYLAERDTLRQLFQHKITANIYGGLNRAAVENLIRRYQAGNRDYGAFLLLYAWRKHLTGKSRAELRLVQASHVFLQALAAEQGTNRAKQLLRAQGYFTDHPGPLNRTDYGFSDWWKISVLLYMLNHPKAQYRTSEFCRHLLGERLRVDPKDVRAFCKAHGIARDSRVGRPLKGTR